MATEVENNPKTPFSIATTPKCRGGCYSFPWLAPLTLDTYLIMLRVKQGGIKYHFFESLVWLDPGLKPGLPNHWRTFYPLDQYIYFFFNLNQPKNNTIFLFELILSVTLPISTENVYLPSILFQFYPLLLLTYL